MKTFIKATVVVLFLAFAISACSKDHTELESMYTLTPTEILGEYKNNEVAADDKYKGKVITISGKVQSIRSGFLGGPKVSLVDEGSGFLGLNSVDCEFKEEDSKTLLSLKVGDVVSIKGLVKGQILGSIMMDGCSL